MQDFGQPAGAQGPPPPPGYGGYPPPPPPPPPPGYGYPPPPGYGPPAQTNWAVATGVMLIIGAVFGFIFGGLFAYGASVIFAFGGGAGFFMCAVLPLLAGIFGVIGAVFSFKRKLWGLVLVASILVLVGGMFIWGLLALIFAILAKDEFS